MTRKGVFTLLHLPDAIGRADGISTSEGHNLYGTSLVRGAIFKGTGNPRNLTILNTVQNSGLQLPYDGVTYSQKNGFLYGTAAKVEGISPSGAIYRVNATGTDVIILHTFGVDLDDTALVPKTVPTETIPGAFYGVTSQSTEGFGAIYKFTDT